MRSVTLLAVCLPAAACGLPGDPGNTYAQARGGQMHVGVIDHEPWTVVEDGEVVGGVETRLATEFGGSIDAEVVFHPGTESELASAAHRFELDLIIGGLTTKSPSGSNIAMSPPYLTERVIVAAPAGVALVEELGGEVVAYRSDERALAAYIRDKGGSPRPVEDLRAVSSGGRTLVAVPAWEADGRGLRPTPVTLVEHKHVLAVPPGENRMLLELAEFLDLHGAAVRERLPGGGR